MIPLTPKEVAIRIARFIFGENRVHDYLIRRGISIRNLKSGYTDSNTTNGDHQNQKQTLVFMADGKWMHGGLTDRLRGIASACRFAEKHNLDFKIFHVSPFNLEDILQPNKVNWTISEKEIIRDSAFAKPVLLYREDFDNDSALERQLDSTHRQFHLYSCVDSLNGEFSKYFNMLFKPSALLEKEIAHYESLLGPAYTSFSFRFQNKLGDFHEFTFKELPTNDKQELLNSALNALKNEVEKLSGSKILVTADSPTFLEEAAKIPEVVIVKGNSIHIDFSSSKNASDYLKAFTEFSLISRATKARLYRNRKYRTYPSNFPKYAALLGNIPYEIIEE